MIERLAARLDGRRFGVKALYLIGSVKRGSAGPCSDIDLLIVFEGTEGQREQLERWLEGWSSCLDELNEQRTGSRSAGLLDVHFVTADDLAQRTSYAVLIGSPTDPARPLRLKNAVAPVTSTPGRPPPVSPDRSE